MLDPEGVPLDQAVTMLRQSHRFSSGSGISQLARAVNLGQADASLAILQAPPPDLTYLTIREKQDSAFESLVLEGGAASDIANANYPTRSGYG